MQNQNSTYRDVTNMLEDQGPASIEDGNAKRRPWGKAVHLGPEGMRDTSWRSLEIEGKGAVNDQDYFGSGGQ